VFYIFPEEDIFSEYFNMVEVIGFL